MIDFYIVLVVDIAKSMIIKTKLLEIEKNNFLGEGIFGSCLKYKCINWNFGQLFNLTCIREMVSIMFTSSYTLCPWLAHAIHLWSFIHKGVKPNVVVEARGLHYNVLFLTMEKHAHFKRIFYKLPNKMEQQKHLHRYPHLATELVAGESPQNVLTRLYNKECFNKH